MTIQADPSQVVYAGDGTTVAFAIPFPFDTAADIGVVLTDSDGDPTRITTGFSISGGSGSTGTLTMDVAPASLEFLTIFDDPELTQPADYTSNDSFPAESHEAALDRTVRQVKRLKQRVDRSIRVADGDNSDGDDLLLPLEAARAGKYLAFDVNGNPIASTGTGGGDSSLRTDLASTADSSDGARLVGYRRSSSMAARSVQEVLKRTIYLDDWGTHGDDDHSAAMYAAEAELVAMGGGTIKIATPGEWRMNWVMTGRGIAVEGFGGHMDYDRHCIRPYSLSSPAITIGDGTTEGGIWYPQLRNLHISGTDGERSSEADDGSLGYLTAHNAPYGLRLRAAIGFRADNVFVYGGVISIACEPISTTPITDVKFRNCKARNDILDNTASRLIYCRREADPAYLTGVEFQGFKGNKSGPGYAVELHGAGCAVLFPGGYIDHKPYYGIYFNNGGSIRPTGLDVDPGNNGVVSFTTTEVLNETTRFIFGYLTQGGQRMAFLGTTTDSGTLQGATSTTAQLRAALALADDALNGYLLVIATGTGAGQQRLITDYTGATDTCTVDAWDTTPDATSTYTVHPTVLFEGEADWHFWRPRISRAYFGPVQYFSPSTNPYDTSMSLERVDAGRMQWVGTDVEIGTAGKGFKIKTGSNAKMGTAVLVGGTVAVSNTSVTANSQIFLTRFTAGGTHGDLSYTKSAGVGFTINSTSGTDTSTINYMIVEAIP